MLRTTESVAFRKLEETVRKSCGYFGKKESAIVSVRCSHEDTWKAAGLLGRAGQPPKHLQAHGPYHEPPLHNRYRNSGRNELFSNIKKGHSGWRG